MLDGVWYTLASDLGLFIYVGGRCGMMFALHWMMFGIHGCQMWVCLIYVGVRCGMMMFGVRWCQQM